MALFRRSDSRLGPEALAKLQQLSSVTASRDRFHAVVRLLLADNLRARRALDDGFPSKKLTDGQNVLASLAILDSEVTNGGLVQLFWNRPGRLEHVVASLRAVKLDRLLAEFQRALEQSAEHLDEFGELRLTADPADGFVAAATLLDFEWFDDQYLGEYDFGKLVKPGADEALYEAALVYVFNNLEQFVQPAKPRGRR